MARTDPTAHPVQVTLDVVSNPSAFELLCAALDTPGSQKDLRTRRGIAQPAASRALREMCLIGLLDVHDQTYSVKHPDACRAMLLSAGRAREAATDADRAALDDFFDRLAP